MMKAVLAAASGYSWTRAVWVTEDFFVVGLDEGLVPLDQSRLDDFEDAFLL